MGFDILTLKKKEVLIAALNAQKIHSRLFTQWPRVKLSPGLYNSCYISTSPFYSGTFKPSIELIFQWTTYKKTGLPLLRCSKPKAKADVSPLWNVLGLCQCESVPGLGLNTFKGPEHTQTHHKKLAACKTIVFQWCGVPGIHPIFSHIFCKLQSRTTFSINNIWLPGCACSPA